jgi:cytochrome P450
MFLSARRSWIDGLYERSYRMQMGEVHLPGMDLYMVNEPALVKRILSEQASNFPKNKLLGDALRPVLGDSILTTNGDQWLNQRRMMEPAFAQARVQVAFPLMKAAVNAMLERLNSLPEATEHDIEIEMTHVTADVILRTIFSVPIEGKDAQEVFEAFARFQSLAPRLILPSIYGIRWLVLPWDVWRSRKAASQIRSLLEGLVRPRFDAHRAGNYTSKADILDSFLNARDPVTNAAFTFDQLVDQVAVLFLAGHETSASALTWAVYLVAQSPDIQSRMFDEISALDASLESSAALEGKSNSGLDATHIKQLELTWNVFRETLRLFPPVGFIARQSSQACPMRDKTIEKGASVVISPWLIQRHKTLWQDPDAFNPDRYQDDQSRESLRNAYLPFGMGPRVCIGAAFALQEAVLILSSLVREYQLRAVPGHVPQPVGRLTIRSANGVRLTLHRRDRNNATGITSSRNSTETMT